MEIRLVNLTKEFVGNPKKNIKDTIAVSNLSLTIPDGKLVGLLGPSGCGKSTTLYLIAGLKEPTSGEIWFGDQDVTNLASEKRGIGLVFQNYALYPHMTVYRNVAFPLTNLKIEKQEFYRDGSPVLDDNNNFVYKRRRLTRVEIDALVHEVSKLVQIDDLLERKPSQLSGGQQQRVAIARALIKKPKVLLLDEPLSNLDARLRIQTREEIKRIQQETGITTIFVTHDQEEAMSICDEIVLMKEGIKQQSGIPQDIYDNPKNQFVASFLGTPPINMFKGEIRENGIFIGEEKISENRTKLSPRGVMVGIRPEAFIFGTNEKLLTINVKDVFMLGRDIQFTASHPQCINDVIKGELNNVKKLNKGEVKCGLDKTKVFLFELDTCERIYFN